MWMQIRLMILQEQQVETLRTVKEVLERQKEHDSTEIDLENTPYAVSESYLFLSLCHFLSCLGFTGFQDHGQTIPAVSKQGSG